MSLNSRRKGANGELELVKELKKYGYDAKRPAQYQGNTGQCADVTGLQGIHIECKRVEQLRLKEWMEQAIHDAQAEGKGNLPAVFHRKNRDRWYVTMCLDDWLTMYGLCDTTELYGGWE